MKLASYYSTREGVIGIGNLLIQWRLKGKFSHNEIVFEPGDGVDHLMPDGTCEPNAAGELWCVSSTGTEVIPSWSGRRAGRRGGVRFKRIKLEDSKWKLTRTDASPLFAATWAKENEGRLYDWQLILGFVAWVFRNKESRVMCTEACATMLGYLEAWRFDPCSLYQAELTKQRT